MLIVSIIIGIFALVAAYQSGILSTWLGTFAVVGGRRSAFVWNFGRLTIGVAWGWAS